MLNPQLDINIPFFYLEDHPKQYFEDIAEKLSSGFNNLKDHNNHEFLIKNTFYSAENINIIQRWLIKEVAKKTKIKIPAQNIDHLKLIMDSIYSLYSQNLPYALKAQIYFLDKTVVFECLKLIEIELKSYSKYIDATQSTSYIDQPISTRKFRYEN